MLRPDDFWGVTAFFGASTDPAILSNLTRFSSGVRQQGLRLLVVELAYADAPFQVTPDLADRLVRVRASTVLWHKERLLNMGIAALPPECAYVAWVDADIIFERESWVDDTRRVLGETLVAQPFSDAYWLRSATEVPPGEAPEGIGDGHRKRSFASVLETAENRRHTLAFYERHGHTGFAWAARRELLAAHPLYDRAILGGGDVIAAHAFAANHDFLTGKHLDARQLSPAERAAIHAWGTPVAALTQGRIGCVPGRVCHLPHGSFARRAYDTRRQILVRAQFDPTCDLASDDSGCWRWNSEKPTLHRDVMNYFTSRGDRVGTNTHA